MINNSCEIREIPGDKVWEKAGEEMVKLPTAAELPTPQKLVFV